MKEKRFIYASFIMIFMNIFTRFFGFTYEIILSKLLGAEAMGVFQMAISLLMFFLVFTISGVPTSVTKFVAEEVSLNNKYNVEKIFKTSLIFNIFMSIFLSFILFSFSEFIALQVFKDKSMIIAVYLLIPPLIIISCSNIIRSYFYGRKNVTTPSVSQTIEHFSRFIIVIGLFFILRPVDPFHGTLIAILGISIGEFFDLLWSMSSKGRLYSSNLKRPKNGWSSFKTLSKVLKFSLPLTISGVFSVSLNFLNSILIPSRLIYAGYTSNMAMASFGRIMGMVMPLIHLPFVVTSALVVSIIPSLSEQFMKGKDNEMKDDISLSIKATLLISIPLTVLFLVFHKALAINLYGDILVSPYIKILALGTPLIALQHLFSGVLTGINRQTSATINRMIGMSLRVLLIYILVGNPKYEINGFFISFFISNLLILLFDIISLRQKFKFKMDYLDLLVKPIIASLFMVFYIGFTTGGLEKLSLLGFPTLLFSLSISFLSYVFILIITNAIPKDFFTKVFLFKNR